MTLIAKSHLPVLILGETGVGKEVMAESIHKTSPRKGRPFVCFNCAALPETLLESELFGHEKGAFTGAVQTKPGLIETADGGTLFLDEVGELPPGARPTSCACSRPREVHRVGIGAKSLGRRAHPLGHATAISRRESGRASSGKTSSIA